MSTIMFIAYPETGHLNPTFRVAKMLKSRGHQVYYLSIPDFECYINSQGLNCITIFNDLCPKGFLSKQASRGVANFSALLTEAKRLGQISHFDPVAQIVDATDKFRPDLFIIDLLLPDIAKIMKQYSIPCVLLNTQFYNPWIEESAAYEPLIDLPELVLCPQEFDFPGAQRKRDCYYVEASIDLDRNQVPFPWEQISKDRPLIYCSFGSQSHLIPDSNQFFHMLVDAIAARDKWLLVLVIGAILSPDEFEPLPPNVIIVNTAPQLELLKKASIMITHGGFNSIKECILLGVPMIVFPLIRDHPAIAARVVYHGLGIRGKFQGTSIEQIQAFIDQIDQNPAFRIRIEWMAERFREMENSMPSVRIIEQTLQQSVVKPNVSGAIGDYRG